MNEGLENGWLDVHRRVESPNYDYRPDSAQVSLLVIHNISLPPNEFEENYVDDFFTNCLNPSRHPFFEEIAHLRVSAHLYIDRKGTVTQYVPLYLRAWHAGESRFDNRSCCNDFSVGIELQGADHIPYTEEQYSQLVPLTLRLQTIFPLITLDRIVGHSDISPDRKTDPGNSFDWQRYLTLITCGAGEGLGDF
ncbi:MAG: 1,6-anhydro-N-acetylmuramyl-L-alanine amidase AmpD [Cellvibrionales bacterium TMED148]|nr:1,6-anhydro-N-acetylmuramyl-L-alanine amidase AmpD [Porticoccaceae bacterium]RPG91666.1 MAG: 1,6-anhydro-N-acetylmuramyl-L-alanine amidase AmpD [Cellvibrionales bacterium TMED148]|tara:strand:+ start:207 stop:785 length:579 start_codon:yes stop_codon:yes gene_type:complete